MAGTPMEIGHRGKIKAQGERGMGENK